MRYYVGIDPGLEGAIAVLYGVPYMVRLEIIDMPIMQVKLTKRKQLRVDDKAVWDLFSSWKDRDLVVALEHLWGFGTAINCGAERGQFSFADDYGLLRGLLRASGFKFLLVPPQK